MNRLILLPLTCVVMCGCGEGPEPLVSETVVAHTVLPATAVAAVADAWVARRRRRLRAKHSRCILVQVRTRPLFR